MIEHEKMVAAVLLLEFPLSLLAKPGRFNRPGFFIASALAKRW